MRKLFRILDKLLLVVIALHLLALIVSSVRNKIYLESSDGATLAYLKNNQYDLTTVVKQTTKYQLPNGDFFKSRVILLGGNPSIADIQALDEWLLVHPNKP